MPDGRTRRRPTWPKGLGREIGLALLAKVAALALISIVLFNPAERPEIDPGVIEQALFPRPAP